jgi:hypothetical protein
MEVEEPVVALDEVESIWEKGCSTEFEPQDRDSDATKTRTFKCGRKLLIGTCSELFYIFYLPSDKLSSTGAAQYSIYVESGRPNKH